VTDLVPDSLLDESVEDFYDEAPCGYLATRPDGTIVKVNRTLLKWIGRTGPDLVGKVTFAELLTAGGRIYHETHFAPLLRMQGEVHGIALEMLCADGTRLPVLVSSSAKQDADGKPVLIRTTVFDATVRREYERELLRARDRERDIALTLQQSLLSGEPPADPRCAIAAHYSPAEASLEVGGDWYDTFMVSEDRLALVVGDVVGRGLGAATAMGQLRSATRALGAAEMPPVRLLECLNAYVEQTGVGYVATVAYVEIDLRESHMRYVCAGHPPPVLIESDGAPRLAWDGRVPPLGLPPTRARVAGEIALAPGTRVLIFSDGLIERRDRSLDDGLDELMEQAASRGGVPIDRLVDELPAAMLRGAPGEDDVCLLCAEIAT
jgi:sigma-B regulation protein RsbU (phosphoserine phosphatase)